MIGILVASLEKLVPRVYINTNGIVARALEMAYELYSFSDNGDTPNYPTIIGERSELSYLISFQDRIYSRIPTPTPLNYNTPGEDTKLSKLNKFLIKSNKRTLLFLFHLIKERICLCNSNISDSDRRELEEFVRLINRNRMSPVEEDHPRYRLSTSSLGPTTICPIFNSVF